MGWLDSSFRASKPATRKSGGAPGWRGGPQPGLSLAAPVWLKSQIHCRSTVLGHLPRRWWQQRLGMEGVGEAEAGPPGHRGAAGADCGATSLLRPACGQHPPTPGAKMTERCGGGAQSVGSRHRLGKQNPPPHCLP